MTIAIPHGPSYHDGETCIDLPPMWVSRREGLDTIATGPKGEEVRLWWHRGRVMAAGTREDLEALGWLEKAESMDATIARVAAEYECAKAEQEKAAPMASKDRWYRQFEGRHR